MKRHLIFFLFLFCALMAVDGRNNPQLVDKRMHFADIYKEPEIAHFSDVPRYIFYEGELIITLSILLPYRIRSTYLWLI